MDVDGGGCAATALNNRLCSSASPLHKDKGVVHPLREKTPLVSYQVTPSTLDSTGKELWSFIRDPSQMNINILAQ